MLFIFILGCKLYIMGIIYIGIYLNLEFAFYNNYCFKLCYIMFYRYIKILSGGNMSSFLYTVGSLEKGIGKTFFMINLAKEIADLTKEKVLLIDFNNDINDVSSLLNVNIIYNTPYFINRLTDGNRDELLKKVSVYKNSTLSIIANGVKRNSETEINVDKLDNFFNVLRKNYKYIFIDNISSEKTVNDIIVKNADNIFCIAQPSSPNLDKVCQMINKLYKGKEVSVILNMYTPRYDNKMEDIQMIIGRNIKWKIPKNIFAATVAGNNGVTLSETNKEMDIVKSYMELAKVITDKH